MEKTLLDRARIDLIVAKENLNKTEDELFLDIAAYHVQQSIEKILKYVCEQRNLTYSKTHITSKLFSLLESNGYTPPEWVYEKSQLIDSYSNSTRYGKELVAERRKVNELITLTEAYLGEKLTQKQESCPVAIAPKDVFIR